LQLGQLLQDICLSVSLLVARFNPVKTASAKKAKIAKDKDNVHQPFILEAAANSQPNPMKLPTVVTAKVN